MSDVKEIKISNTVYDIVGKGVENQRDTSKAKVWLGSNAQYNDLQNLDSNTVYYRRDNGGTVQTAVNATNATNDGSGNNIASTYATKTEIGNVATFDLFDRKWSDHLLNDQNWLRADTFSWQNGTVYTDAYQHLVKDLESSKKMFYGWISGNPLDLSNYYTLSATPSVGDAIYSVENNTSADALTTIASISGTTIVGANGISYFSNDPETRELYLLSKDTIGAFDVYYYLASDGHKIVAALNEEDVSDVYDEFGVTWYYILDTANQRFKLPRTKYGVVGLRDTVGKYVPETLPNFNLASKETNTVQGGSAPAGSIVYGANNGGGINSGGSNFGQTAPMGLNVGTLLAKGTTFGADNSAYQENAPVQQRATQMYLYFYVGQFTQTATEQTAGLNSELFNGKVDLNAANLSTQGKSLISGLGMPSDRYVDLTLGASGTAYTAPAAGYFVLDCPISANPGAVWAGCGLNNGLSWFDGRISTAGSVQWTTPPCQRGAVVEIYYNNLNTGSVAMFRFVYAKGSESEA